MMTTTMLLVDSSVNFLMSPKSLMTSGNEGLKHPLRMSAKKTEVGDVFNPSVKPMKCTLLCAVSQPFARPYPDLDSAVSSRGLDQILTPPAGQHPNQPRARSFFQSVVVTKVLKPDGVSKAVYRNLTIIYIPMYPHSICSSCPLSCDSRQGKTPQTLLPAINYLPRWFESSLVFPPSWICWFCLFSLF